MRRLLLCFAVSCWLAASAAAGEDPVAAELRKQSQELLDAIAPGKAEVWQKYVDDQVIHVDENGTVRGKAELVKEITPLPPGLVGSIAIVDYQVRRHGDVAVATLENRELLDYHGQKLDSRWRVTETWRKTKAGWRLIGSQTLAMQVDPPAASLPRATLCAYDGTYQLSAEIRGTLRCADDGIVFEREGRPAATWKPELQDVFFAPGQPRTRRIFQRDAKGAIAGFVDRREGHDIAWRRVGS